MWDRHTACHHADSQQDRLCQTWLVDGDRYDMPKALLTHLLTHSLGCMQAQVEAQLQNIDLLTLTEDGAGMTLNPQWLDYLEVS